MYILCSSAVLCARRCLPNTRGHARHLVDGGAVGGVRRLVALVCARARAPWQLLEQARSVGELLADHIVRAQLALREQLRLELHVRRDERHRATTSELLSQCSLGFLRQASLPLTGLTGH